jgi:Fe-S cluster biogenesis protein NfuA
VTGTAPAAPDLAATGERIEALLAYFTGSGGPAGERAEELVRLMADLYGAGLERLLEIVHDAGALQPRVLEALAADELVSSLLLVHGLHPYDVTTRVERALDQVRPYLGSHGGDVELLGVEDDAVRLRLVGSCGSCPSSAVTLELAVRDALEAAAPEISRIDCEEASAQAVAPGLIPVESLRRRISAEDGAVAPAGTVWEPVDLAGLVSGEVRRTVAGGLDLVLCRVGTTGYAFQDGCPACGRSLGGAALERTPGTPAGSAVLTCPGCRAHYDVRRAGAPLDPGGEHLSPLPLLERQGGMAVAVPGRVPA